MSQLPGSAPIEDIERWLTGHLLTKTNFTKTGLRNVILRLNDSEERKRLMDAVGQSCRMFAGELVYKLFRHPRGSKKKLVKNCDAAVDAICVNPYHYQLVDHDGSDVADELSDAVKFRMNLLADFPQIDVNELPDRDESSDNDAENEEIADPELFFAGASKALSSTAVARPDAELSEQCKFCEEKDARIAELEAALAEKDAEIDALKKQIGNKAKSEAMRDMPPRAAKPTKF